MSNEENKVLQIISNFPNLDGRIRQTAPKRIFTDPLESGEFHQLVSYIHDEMGFFRAHHAVGVDDGENLGFIYIFSDEDNTILAAKQTVPKENPEIESLNKLYPSLLLHELELADLFGAVISGLPDVPHYPLPDGWPQGSYPMRKEWKPEYFNKETMTYEPPEEVQKNG